MRFRFYFLFWLLNWISQTCFALGSGFQCGDIFDSETYTTLQLLFERETMASRDFTPTVKVAKYLPDGTIELARKYYSMGWFKPPRLRSWQNQHLIKRDESLPQGDVRSFIFLAGPVLAKRLGIYFVERNGEVLLVAPTAQKLEKVVRALNATLLSLGKKERIAYLPKEFRFAKPGEILKLAQMKDDSFAVQFPFMDFDPVQLLHELSYHLGAMLFPEVLHEKSREINLEYGRMKKLLSKLPAGATVAEYLVKQRESELDVCNANLAVSLVALRKKNHLAPFASLKMDTEERAAMMAEINGIAHPYYSPAEAVAIEMIIILGLQNKFADRPELVIPVELRTKNIISSNYLPLPPADLQRYHDFIRQLLAEEAANATLASRERTDSIAYRTETLAVLTDMLQTMDQRLEEFVSAFDEIDPIPHQQKRRNTLLRKIFGH